MKGRIAGLSLNRLWLALSICLILPSAVISQSNRPQLMVQLGHSEIVSAAAFSPNGRLVATGGDGGELILWETDSGRILRQLRGHENRVLAVQFRAEGKELVTIGSDRRVKIWETLAGRELKTLNLEGVVAVDRAEILPDGNRIATAGSFSPEVTLWELSGGTMLGQFTGQRLVVASFAISPDGKLLAIADPSKVQLVETATGLPSGTLTGHLSAVKAIKFSRDGTRIVTHGADDTLRLWSVETQQVLKNAEKLGVIASGDSVFFSPDEQKVILFDKSSGDDFRIWDLSSGAVAAPLPDEQSAYFAAFSPADNTLLLGGEGIATLWDMAAGRASGELKGNAISIEAVAYSPDGKYYATGGSDGDAHLWEVKTGREVAQFKGHTETVDSVAFSPDSRLLATASADNTVRLWTLSGGKPKVLRGHTGAVNSVDFSPDGKLLITGSTDQTARLWDAQTGGELKVLSGHSARVSSVAFSRPDGRLAITDTSKAEVLWDVETGNQVGRLEGHSSEIGAAAFSPDGRWILTGCNDGVARLWERATGKLAQRFAHSGIIKTVAFSPDSKSVLTVSGDKAARLWDIATGKELRAFEGTARRINYAAISPDGKDIATAGSDGTVRLWSLTTAQPGRVLTFASEGTRPTSVDSLSFAPNGLWLAAAAGRSLRVWNLNTGQELDPWTLPAGHILRLAGFSSDGKYLVTIVNSIRVMAMALVPGQEAVAIKINAQPPPEVVIDSHAFSPDGKLLLLGGYDKSLKSFVGLFEIATGQELRRLPGRSAETGSASIQSLSFSPDGQFFFAGSADARGRIYETATGNEVGALLTHKGGTRSVAFSPDGRYVATGGGDLDDNVRLWEVAARTLVRMFDGRLVYGVSSIAFSPDGKRLLTGSADGIVRLWDVASGSGVATFIGHTASVNSVTFTLDGQRALSASTDGTTRLWDMERKQEVCSLISFAGGLWTVVAPDGRFDTNSFESLGGLHWVLPDNPERALSQEIFTRDFYRTQLLPDLLKGNAAADDMPSLATLNLAQPDVKVVRVDEQTGSPGLVSVTVEVTEGKTTVTRGGQSDSLRSGAYDLRLFRDGHQVRRYPARPLDEASARLSPSGLEAWRATNKIELDSAGKFTYTFRDVRVPLREGVDSTAFTSYAFNEDRVKSLTRPPLIHPLSPRPDPSPRRAYIITVGVGANQSDWDLSFATQSALDVERTLRERLEGSYEVVGVRLLSEREPDGPRVQLKEATKENIRAVFDLLAGRPVTAERLRELPEGVAGKMRAATPDDLVLFFISSHGYADPQRNFYVVPYNTGRPAGVTELTLKECLSSTDESARCAAARAFLGRAISSDELSDWWGEVDGGEMVMILDSCYSGAAPGGGFRPGPLGDTSLGQLSYDKGMQILAAAQPDKPALASLRVGTGRSLLADALTKSPLATPKQAMMVWLNGAVQLVPEQYKALYPEVREGDAQLPLLLDFTRKN